MNEQSLSKDERIWNRLVEAYLALAMAEMTFRSATSVFLSEDIDRVALIRKAFYNSGSRAHRLPAVFFLSYLNTEELEELFDDLVLLAVRVERVTQAICDIISTLPSEWVFAHIEKAMEPLLSTDSSLEYRRLLQLCSGIDRDLALRLAHKAAEHSDYDIREAGEDFLKDLGDLRASSTGSSC